MNFARVVPALWRDHVFKEVVAQGPGHITLALYLRTNRYCNMLGLYAISTYHMVKQTGLDNAKQILGDLIQTNYCAYDEESEFVWVYDMAKMQVPTPLNSKQLKGIRNHLIRLYHDEDCPFVEQWMGKHKSFVLGIEHEVIVGIRAKDDCPIEEANYRPIKRPTNGMEGSIDRPIERAIDGSVDEAVHSLMASLVNRATHTK